MNCDPYKTLASVCNNENQRRILCRNSSFKYEPAAWDTEIFITHAAPTQKPREWIDSRIMELKEKVRELFISTTDCGEMVNLIDTIEHLGIGYQFKREIDDALNHVHRAKFGNEELHIVATGFRLLRQHGFNVSSDEFLKFKDHMRNFDDKLCEDTKGLLSLYNAGYLAIPGEKILDDAISFAKRNLTSIVDNLRSPLKKQVLRSLKTPVYKMMTRVEARFYIEEYEEEGKNDLLLELAKLDFNVVQSLHMMEIKNLSLWWKGLNISENLKYARDRLVECFALWTMGLYFEPEYSRARIMCCKLLALGTLVDDTFDVYGTYEDCKLLTAAVQRWDKKAVDSLPAYLQGLYLEYINTINSFKDELEPTEKYRFPFLIESIKTLIDGLMQEVEWHAAKQVPTFDDRKTPALDGNVDIYVTVGPLIGMPGEIITEETFQWLTTRPDVALDCMRICRYTDEFTSFEREANAGQGPTTFECYMIEHKLTKEAAKVKFQSFCNDAWKRLNLARIQQTSEAMMPALERLVNHARAMQTMYVHFNDAFNKCSNGKEIIALLLLKPFSL